MNKTTAQRLKNKNSLTLSSFQLSKKKNLRTLKQSPPTALSTSTKSYHPNVLYSYKEDQNPLYKSYMEDISLIKLNLQKSKKHDHLFGIFDGHGGVKSAQLSSDKYTEILLNTLKYNQTNNSTSISIEKCLSKSFEVLDKETLNHNCFQCGNTATIVYITGKLLYCTNVGDSKCVLITRDGGVSSLTKDDKCTDESEIQRIQSVGGKIINNRVSGCLAITRAIGDHELKDKGLICTPHITKHLIGVNDHYCVIASDGVWDALSNDDIRILVNNTHNSKQLAEDIVNTSISYGSKDNVSCIVIGFY